MKIDGSKIKIIIGKGTVNLGSRRASTRNNRLKAPCGRAIPKHTSRTLITSYLGRFPVPPKDGNRASLRPKDTYILPNYRKRQASNRGDNQPANQIDSLSCTYSQVVPFPLFLLSLHEIAKHGKDGKVSLDPSLYE